LFGAAGTVLGAALGSVVSTLAAAVYEHSLDRTRDTVKARIKLPGGRTVDVAGKVEVPAPRVAAGGEAGQARVFVTPAESTNRRSTMVLPSVSPASPARPRRRWVALTALAFGVFLIGLLAVTGVELLKGSTLTRGETGTSVGRVVDPRPVSADPTEPTETGSTTPTETAERTGTPATPTIESTTEATATESVTDESDGGTGRTGGGSTDAPEDSSADDEADVGATSAATPTPTPTRSPDGD
jgi:cytoskeletal protein RodZ